MKVKNILSVAVATTFFLASCTSHLRLTKEQALSMSPQAADTLRTLKLVRFPIINISDKLIIKVRKQWAEFDKAQLATMKAKFNPTIKDTIINNVKVVIITPQNIKPENKDKAMIYIHGGGFVTGTASDQTGMLMANEIGLKTYAIEYQLAPEAKYPVAMNECVEVYKYLVSKYKPSNIVGVSISAGCNHMLAMLLKAKQLNLPMINSISLISPAVDLTNTGDSPNFNDGRDVLAFRNNADKLLVKPFIGKASPTDPLVSPIYSNYQNDFPATSIVTGTRDLLLSGSIRLFWKLKEANVPTELLIGEGMWHTYTMYADIPEAVKTRKATQDFLLHHLNK
jgi:epsilon-lactone hydrolase